MDIFTVAESLDEHGVFRKMRHDAQLDLRVVRGQQHFPFLGNEGGANLAPQFAPYRNILQIGSLELSRPVAVPVCEKLVCRRAVTG